MANGALVPLTCSGCGDSGDESRHCQNRKYYHQGLRRQGGKRLRACALYLMVPFDFTQGSSSCDAFTLILLTLHNQ